MEEDDEYLPPLPQLELEAILEDCRYPPHYLDEDNGEDNAADGNPQQIAAEEHQPPERDHRDRAAAPAVVYLPANGSANAIRCTTRRPSIILRSPTDVGLQLASSGCSVTHKALVSSNAQCGKRPRVAELPTSARAVAGCKRPRHHYHSSTPSPPQSERSRSASSSASSTSPLWSPRRRGRPSLIQRPPSSERHRLNAKEKKRREEFRVGLEALRKQVPSLADNEKVATVNLLKEAAKYTLELAHDLRKNDLKKMEEQKRHDMLKGHLAMLQQRE